MTKSYKKIQDNIENGINSEAKDVAAKLNLDYRISIFRKHKHNHN